MASLRPEIVVLEVIRAGIRQRLPDVTFDANVTQDYMTQQMILTITQQMLGKKMPEETSYTEVPDTWWDAFKLRFFPKWKRKMRTITIRTVYKVCPHLKVPDDRKHFDFLMMKKPVDVCGHFPNPSSSLPTDS